MDGVVFLVTPQTRSPDELTTKDHGTIKQSGAVSVWEAISYEAFLDDELEQRGVKGTCITNLKS